MANLSETDAAPKTDRACALCQTVGPLQDSHLVPKFVFRFLRRTSPGLIRMSTSPNRLHQDGPTMPLLCGRCEGRLNEWETPFAREIFLPLHENRFRGVPQFPYRDWALKFAVSVSWRTVQYLRAQNGQLTHLSSDQQDLLRRAERTWTQFLLGEVEHPGEFEHHAFPLDVIETGGVQGLSPIINRYLLRAVDGDLVAAPGSVIVYTKMLRILVIGFVQMEDRSAWLGGKLHVRRGTFGTRRYRLPGAMRSYINSRAAAQARALRSLSPRQRERTRQVIDSNLVTLGKSEVFRAVDADVRLFGSEAFRVTAADGEEP
jgi:hypothetical protein